MPPCPPGPLSRHSVIVSTKCCLMGPRGPSWVLWGQSGMTASLSGSLGSSRDPLGEFSSTLCSEHSHWSSNAFCSFFGLFLTSSMFPDAANVSALLSGLSSSTRSLPGEHFRRFRFECLLIHSDVLHSFVDCFQSSLSHPYTPEVSVLPMVSSVYYLSTTQISLPFLNFTTRPWLRPEPIRAWPGI